TRTNFPKRTWFSASTFEATRHRILSGGDWLTAAGKRTGEEAFAVWELRVGADGEYALWTRKFWKHGPFRWRFDDGPWQTCGRDVALADSTPIRTHLCVNWVHLGRVKLSRGKHTFELRLLAKEGEDLTACFDCFLLTTNVFIPRGKLKPGERSGLAEPGWWAFEPSPDAFGDALLDLRHLNEKVAGEKGFVARKGDGFVLGDGTPVRFWAVNVGGEVVRLAPELQRYLARRLAKVGVNMVRVHSALFDRGARDPASVDRDYLDDLHRFVAALKNEGIYAKLSFYFPLWFDVKPTYGMPGYDTVQNKKPFALLYFDPRMQEIYRSWARVLLATVNPYTGLPLGRDPAVAVVEIVNEDSLLFWTFSAKNIPRAEMGKLEKGYADWLVKRHGSVDRAVRSWGARGRFKDDDLAAGRVALLDAWHFTSGGLGKAVSRERMSDQVRFLVETQRRFYDDTVAHFRRDPLDVARGPEPVEGLGARNLVSCSNWQTADPRLLDALERYSYTAGDVIDRHGYFGGRHSGEGSGYQVREGHTFVDRAGVLEPAAIPLQVNAVQGYPHIISEVGWPNPNRYKAEFPFLAAVCGSLQGLDGIFFFAVGTPGWEDSAGKFPVACPTVMGQFPALALAYRRGDIREGEVVAHEALTLDDLFAFKGSAAVTPPNLDDLRKADVPTGGTRNVPRLDAIDPLAFHVGRVTRGIDERGGRSLVRDLSKQIDREGKRVRSTTGQLDWDYGTGVVTLDTPCTLGVCGFLRERDVTLAQGIGIAGRNEFGSIVVTSLDGMALGASKKFLIQAMTEERPYGWKVNGDKVVDLGGYPMNVRAVDAVVTLKRPAVRSVTVLDEHGYARGKVAPERVDDGWRIRLPEDALYTLVELP
ncbi:MAG TPA: hypothetical protein VMY39_02725, partial [Planctomycetota bacterium]|nr:hypothetical protein [Planctomycetota bacterium]